MSQLKTYIAGGYILLKRTKFQYIANTSLQSGENLAGEGWAVVLEDRWGGVSITATSQHHHWDETDEELLQMDHHRRYRSKVVELLQVCTMFFVV